MGEVVQRKNDLEKRWIKIESDWKGIGRELQEDEWVEVLRNVGKQVRTSTTNLTLGNGDDGFCKSIHDDIERLSTRCYASF